MGLSLMNTGSSLLWAQDVWAHGLTQILDGLTY